jgi:uncharacterized ferritin-like protein (DUF455 family)
MATDPQRLSDFAKLVLFSPNLEDKMTPPLANWVDDASVSAPLKAPPESPARSPEIMLDKTSRGAKNLFPGKAALGKSRSRGQVLHFFANHELLALELMALALLKWPEAPLGFRKGLVQTMIEEQNHMRLYLDRMSQLGVTFGELPLNSFFWKCMSHLNSPLEFTAAMSMTFEQANIDFALHYERLFLNEGDHETSEILKRVRIEEIGHVKHGYTWFDRWRPNSERLFKEWADALKFPMTPARAKGLTFDRDGRIASGLPISYIDELEVHFQSKGRPPRVFWFNPACEQEISFGSNKWTPPKPIADLTDDYAILMSLFAHSDDVVLVSEHPHTEHLKRFYDWGFSIPEFVEMRKINQLHLRKIESFHPWGWSPEATRVFNKIKRCLLNPTYSPPTVDTNAHSSLSSKATLPDIRKKLEIADIDSIKVSTVEECKNAIAKTLLRTKKYAVIKSPFSASGRGMLRAESTTLPANASKWIQDELGRHGALTVEPWLEKKFDFSAHVDIEADGRVKFAGITRFWTDQRGQYRGHLIGRTTDDLGPEVIQTWHREDHGWAAILKSVSIKVGEYASTLGYYGPLGVDSMVYCENSQLKIRPLLEINPRWSMGRVALALQKKITAKHCAILIHINRKECQASGHGNFSDLYHAIADCYPNEIFSSENSKIIRQGVFCINDPKSAKQTLAMVIVGKRHSECYEILNKAGIYDKDLESQIG